VTESEGSNPGQREEVYLSFFIFLFCCRVHSQPKANLLDICQVTCSGRRKKRGITAKNPCSAICEANTDIRVMFGRIEGSLKKTLKSLFI